LNKKQTEYDLNIQLQHVPFFIHVPKFTAAKTISKNGKLIDLFPTVASLAKLNHTNFTLVNNLLDSTNSKNASFMYLKINVEPAVDLLQDSLYYYKTNVTKNTGLYILKINEYPLKQRKWIVY
jgi:phosphoglycerol transferase MdoB-like AlkP superfamily enzyme